MPKVTQFKVAQVFIKELSPGKWRASWMDPLTSKHVRRILPATAYREAKAQAQEINKDLAASRGFGGRLRGGFGHGVADAVIEAVKHTDGNERTRRQYIYCANQFINYLEAHAAGVRSWGDVTEEIIGNHVEYFRREDIPHDTMRLRLYVVRLTSKFMSRTYPKLYRHVTVDLRMKRTDPSKAELEAKSAILTTDQLRELLAWLKSHSPMVHVWATLQGLCGLRLYECAYLREGDLDPLNGTITIAKSEAHKPKNRPSYRTIPMPPAVAQVLAKWMTGLKVRSPHGYLFHPAKATTGQQTAKTQQGRAGAYSFDGVDAAWRKALRRARQDGLNIPEKFTPRRLRGSFVTAMRKAGVDIHVLQAYIGHQPTTILTEHYDTVDIDRMRPISALAQELFEGSGAFKETGTQRAPEPMQR